MEVTKKTKKQTNTYIKLTKDDIILFLKKTGVLNSKHENIEVTFKVPSGADWSGMDIEIDQDNPILITCYHELTLDE